MQVRYVSNITKEYPDMFQIIVYRGGARPFIINENTQKNYEKDSDVFQPTVSSVRRTQSLISDIVLCNNFDYFATFTFSPKYHINRYNECQCRCFLNRWLHHQKERRSPNLQYLAVPEKHKDGAIHFHVLLKNFNGTLKDSKKIRDGRKIYNLTGWRAGFSTAVHIDNKQAVSVYVRKYITKDFCNTFNKRRFFCSNGLIRPVRSINSSILNRVPPLFHEKVYENSDVEIFNISKSLLDKQASA